jgi:hypothetical protein
MPSQFAGSRALDPLSILRGITGALAGAAVGFVLFRLILQLGFYAIVIPGALTGMGGGWLSRRVSNTIGLICALIAAAITIFSEWYVAPFIVDEHFTYFITHLHQTRTIFQILAAVGIVMAFYFGRGRPEFVPQQG